MPNGLLHLAFIGPGGSEILVVMLVLLLLFGAQDAPRMFRKLNDILNQLRSTAENFKREVMYSDLDRDEEPQRSAGEYDEYGLDDNDDQAEDVEAGEAADQTESEAEPEVDVGAEADEVEGGDGDVQKT